MDRSELQKLLEVGEPGDGARLPDSFGPDVLRRGKRLRALVRQHWTWLRWTSLISLLLAILLGLSLLPFPSTEPVPSMPLFQSHSEAAPFSTR